MDRHQQAGIGDVAVGAHRLLRVHVDIGPGGVVGADRHQGEVEGPVVGADPGEAVGVSGVAAEVRAVPRPEDRPRGPQRGVARQETAGEVPRRGADQPQLADSGLGVPVQFDDPLGGDVPLPQVRADTEGHHERRPLGAHQVQHGVHVEVVVVVVADHHGVEFGQGLQRQRDRVQPLGADRARRRAAVAPDRVGEHAVAVDLQQRRGMAEPVHRQRLGSRVDGRCGEGYGAAGAAGRPAGDHVEQDQPVLLGVELERRCGFEVVEHPVAVVGRAVGDGADGARPGAQRRGCVVQRPQDPAAGGQRSGAGGQAKGGAQQFRRPGTSAPASRCARPAPRSRPGCPRPCRRAPCGWRPAPRRRRRR